MVPGTWDANSLILKCGPGNRYFCRVAWMILTYTCFLLYLIDKSLVFFFFFWKKWKHLASSKRGWDSAEKQHIDKSHLHCRLPLLYLQWWNNKRCTNTLFCDSKWKQEVVSYWKHYLHTFYLSHPILFICFVFSNIKVTYRTPVCSVLSY